eukprot:TRINITY_DN6294_c0_g1_i3.p1 TRINITY_DN6294_c0_g1~~TRINITY_DN6294_c0_g1_i3.p1  ORF type:complete len:102 (-),score=22.82 TRINITY_DN6294_c0_g1_i3:13-318(-)
MLGNNIRLVIAGNKIDLERERTVQQSVAEEYAKRVGATHFNTSAKLNKGIDELFLHLAKTMSASDNDTSKSRLPPSKTRLILDDEPPVKAGGGGCCGGGNN